MDATPLEKAVAHLGGQAKAGKVLGRTQSRISDYLKKGSAPAEVCIKIEVATNGKFTAEQIRPDLAADFRAFRKQRKARAI